MSFLTPSFPLKLRGMKGGYRTSLRWWTSRNDNRWIEFTMDDKSLHQNTDPLRYDNNMGSVRSLL
jgi:hypothetical protein